MAIESIARRTSIGLVTVTQIQVTPDMRFCKVWISILNEKDQKEIDRVVSTLTNHAGEIRSALAQKLKLRHTPQFHFVYDEMTRYINHMNEVFQTIPEPFTHETDPHSVTQ